MSRVTIVYLFVVCLFHHVDLQVFRALMRWFQKWIQKCQHPAMFDNFYTQSQTYVFKNAHPWRKSVIIAIGAS